MSNHPQSQRTSVEGGSIDFNDDDGNLMAIVGSQDDGGNTINVLAGPTPPTPVGFTVDVDHGKFIVHWSGDFDGDALAPSDWSRAEVHASQDPFFVPSRATARGSIVSAAGGEVTIGVLKGPWTIKMLAWSQAGKMSAPSAAVDVEVPGYGDIVLEEIDAATTLIKNAGEMLLEGQQTLADKLAGIADLDPEEISDEIAQARQEAIDAAMAELDALEGTLTTKINGKTTTQWSTSDPPASYSGTIGDTWIKLTSLGTGGREIARSKWNGTSWTVHKVDGASLSNVDASTITAGFLDVANRIRSSSIFGEKLLIGGASEMTHNPFFDTEGAGWGPSTGGATFSYSSEAALTGHTFGLKSAPTSGGSTIYMTSLGTGAAGVAPRIVMEYGKRYRVEAWVRRTAGSVANLSSLQLRTYFYATPTGGAISNQLADGGTVDPSTIPVDTWVKVTGVCTPPSPAYVHMYPRPTIYTSSTHPSDASTWHLGMLSIKEQVDGTLITPGGIQTPHLAADVLEVGNLKAGTAALAEAVIKKLFAEVVVARMAQAEEFIGENAILTGAVTAPKITASEELWAKLGQFVKIRSEHIESDALDFMVARGGTYLTSGGNGSWSDNGLFISGPDGTSLVRFPTDGTPLSLTASDVQIDRASVGDFDITQQTVRSGGTVTLASGVTAPASPPELSAAWRRNVQLSRPAEASMDWTGFAYWNDKYVRGVNVLGSEGDPYDRIEVYNLDGTLNKSINIDLNPRAGVAVIGDTAYTIGPDHVAANAGKQWCHGFNLNTGARVSRWEFTRFFSARQKKITVGTDGTNLMVAGVAPGALLSVFKYTPATGAQVGAQLSVNFDTGADPELFGVTESGGKVYVSPQQQVRQYSVSGSNLVLDRFAWDNPNKNAGGMTFVDGVPLVVDSGAVYTGSSFSTNTALQVCYTWWNGSQETTPSPVANVALKSRESVTVSMAKRAGLQKRLYVRTGSSGNWYGQVVGTDVTSLTISDLGAGSGWGSLVPLPTANTFPASTPAILKSGGGNFEARGDGSGKWGPLTFNANGTMAGLLKHAAGRVIMTPTSENQTISTFVTFPAGRFSTSPSVVATPDTTVPGSSVLGVGTSSPSATGFTLYFRRTSVAPTGVTWIAMEMD
ncbi:hypothetical protein [Brevibacterium sediminis]|uniref:hypothetical protein n=1 Tax=Brevibacterium sediminis TaxID=1857024 RepID=UPI003671D507